ncbi:hypothetical protein Peur_012049 [Populus x canadensis]
MHDSSFCCCLFLFLNTFLITLIFPLRSKSLGINSMTWNLIPIQSCMHWKTN